MVTLGLVALGGIGLTAAAGAGFGFASGEDSDGDGGPPATAEVRSQDLVATTEEQGDFGYAAETRLRAQNGTVTWLAEVAATVKRGEHLFRVDEEPTVLLYGELPAYRTLEPESSGADVKQFEENLSALGYTGFDVDEHYTWATAEAVMEWQEQLGVEETGVLELGRVHYAAGPVVVTAHSASLGDAAGELLTVASRDRVITVDLDRTDSRFAVVGAAVTVTLPDGTTFSGTIESVRPTVVDGDVEGEDVTVLRVSVAPEDQSAVADLPSSSAKVAFEAERRDDVLTVPVTALLALAEGGYGVEVVEETRTRLVAVETGLFANGFVEVSGDGIAEGDDVVIPE